MNPKKIVILSNIIGIISIILLIYWVFIFISIEVFGLKIFRENMTQTFYLSIIGILALMFGALMINIMFNLSRIAQKHNDDIEVIKNKKNKILLISFIASFPIIFSVLFLGDFLTSAKKERMLINAGVSIVQNNTNDIKNLCDYKFDKEWIKKTADILSLMSKIDKNYKSVSIIVYDKIDKTPVFLEFRRYDYLSNDREPDKINYVLQTSIEERKYLTKVFTENYNKELFSAHDGNYKLFYPVKSDNNIVVFYFSDRQEYGKIGS